MNPQQMNQMYSQNIPNWDPDNNYQDYREKRNPRARLGGHYYVKTPSFIMRPCQWNRTPEGKIITAATPSYFPDLKPIGKNGQYNIYLHPDQTAHGERMKIRSRF